MSSIEVSLERERGCSEAIRRGVQQFPNEADAEKRVILAVILLAKSDLTINDEFLKQDAVEYFLSPAFSEHMLLVGSTTGDVYRFRQRTVMGK